MRSVIGPGIGSARSNRSRFRHLAEVRRVEQLLQTDDLRAALRGLADAALGVVDRCVRVRRHRLLNESDREWRVGH